MKRFSILFTLFVLAIGLISAHGINLSLTLNDINGTIQPSTDATLRVSIVTSDDGSDILYSETHNVTSNPYGAVHTLLGEGHPVSGIWQDIDWSIDPLYIHIERDDNNGNFNTISIMRLGAAPYAYHAESAENITLQSPNGKLWNLEVDDYGHISATAAPPANAPAYGTVDYLFDMQALPEITIEVTTEQWNELLHNYDLNRANEECVHANIYFKKYGRTHSLQDIGLRLRGNTTRVRPEGDYGTTHTPGANIRRVHFGFRFQKFHKDDPAWTLSGTDRFNLRWAKVDPTYIHEIYGYDLMRRFGVYTTARASFCKVYLKFAEEEKPVYMGISEMFECYDDQYLADHTDYGDFAGTSGYMWKGGWGPYNNGWDGAFFWNPDKALMGICNETLDPTETEEYAYDYKSKKKKLEDAKTQLSDFISKLNSLSGEEFKNWAESSIDVDLMLRVMACEAALGHWDDFWCNGNNFYMYFDNDGDKKMKFMPYDLDNTLGNGGIYANATRDLLNWGNSPLANKLLEVPEYRSKYISFLKELADPQNDYLDPDKSASRIKKWHELIKDYVKNDTWEGNIIEDKSSSYEGNPEYHLLQDDNNFFRLKVQTINALDR